MKVLMAKEPGIAVYTDEFEKPVPTGDFVVVKIVRNGICATDLAILSGEAGFMHDGSTPYPVRFGHEYSGIVSEIGPDVTKVKIGDHVIGRDQVVCNECDACKAGDYMRCINFRAVGTKNTWPGSYADYLMVPERNVMKVPEGMGHDVAALVEPAAIAMSGITKIDIVPGETEVLVVGVGAIGIAAAAFAKHRGAKKVMIAGRTPYKLELAKKMGADVVCNTNKESIADFVKRETNGNGVQYIIECSGNINVLDDCLEAIAIQGTLVIISFYETEYKTFKVDNFVFKEATIRAAAFHAMEEAVEAINEGVDLMPLITRRIKFDEAGQFMMDQIKQRSGDIKVMVEFD